jgi:predicted HAD superfamily phosphohydrolase YqeG
MNQFLKDGIKECVENIDNTIIQWEKILKEHE